MRWKGSLEQLTFWGMQESSSMTIGIPSEKSIGVPLSMKPWNMRLMSEQPNDFFVFASKLYIFFPF